MGTGMRIRALPSRAGLFEEGTIMAHARWAFLIASVAFLSLTAMPSHAAPLPMGAREAAPTLIESVCHRGWHHRSGRPCGYGGPYAPFYGGPRYGPGPGYGYYRSGRRCRWVYNQWGQQVRVCRW